MSPRPLTHQLKNFFYFLNRNIINHWYINMEKKKTELPNPLMGDLLIDQGLSQAELLARVPGLLAQGNALLADLQLVDFLADPAIQATLDQLLFDFSRGALGVGALAIGAKLLFDRVSPAISSSMGDGLGGFFAALGQNFIEHFTSIGTLLNANQKSATTTAAARLGTALLAGTKIDQEAASTADLATTNFTVAIRIWKQITLAKSQIFLLQGLDVLVQEPATTFYVFFYAGRPVGPIEGGTLAIGELIASPGVQVNEAMPTANFGESIAFLMNQHPFAVFMVEENANRAHSWRVGGNDYIPMKSFHYKIISENSAQLDAILINLKGHKVELDFSLFFNF